MSGAILLIPLDAFVASTGRTLSFYLLTTTTALQVRTLSDYNENVKTKRGGGGREERNLIKMNVRH